MFSNNLLFKKRILSLLIVILMHTHKVLVPNTFPYIYKSPRRYHFHKTEAIWKDCMVWADIFFESSPLAEMYT